MSRELPERPNLDHLRRQARALLRERRKRDPQVQLATAQRLLAREYGFASWQELKSHVEAQAAKDSGRPVVDYPFSRYTTKARQALFFSRDEASRAGSTSIEPEHVLLGSLRAGLGSRVRVFDRVQVSLDAARAKIVASPAGRPVPSSVEIPFSGVTRRVLLTATGEADRLGHETIGLAHLLLGMLDRQESRASSILIGWGATASQVRDRVRDLLDEETG
jgi:Clp amino terminal domain, pathogenicity island component